jgi:hypothetical protein
MAGPGVSDTQWDPRIPMLTERLDQLEQRLDGVTERLDALETKLVEVLGAKKPQKKNGHSAPGVCVVTGQPSGEDCEHWSTYRYQNGCQGACLDKGREYYRKYYYDRTHKQN